MYFIDIKEILESFLFCMYLGSFTLPLHKAIWAQLLKWQNTAGSKKILNWYWLKLKFYLVDEIFDLAIFDLGENSAQKMNWNFFR